MGSMNNTRRAFFIGFLAMCFALDSQAEAERVIANFSLKNSENKMVSSENYEDAKGLIVVFTGNKCPMANLYTDRLNDLSEKYAEKSVFLLAINSLDTLVYKTESLLSMQKKVKEKGFAFPYLQDFTQIVSKQFGATYTPQAFVIWKSEAGKWLVKYEGAVDDSALEPSKANRFLEHAIDELLENKKVSNPITKSVGCRIYYRGEVVKMD